MHRRVHRLLIVALTGGHQTRHAVQFLHVLLQIEVPAKALAAYLTGERLLVVVRVHVERQIVDLMEGLVAHGAFVFLHAAVRQRVILVISLLMKSLAAELAYVRLEVGVYARMSVQRGTSVEGLAASLTLVRFFGGVDDLVSAESARLAETFAAYLADEGSGARVHGHVSGEIVMSVEDFAADGTGEGLLLVRRAYLVPWSWILLATVTLRDRHSTHLQGSLLNGARWWRDLCHARSRRRRTWKCPQQGMRVIVQKGIETLIPQGWYVFLEGRHEVSRVTRQGWNARCLIEYRWWCRQTLVRFHDLRYRKGQVPGWRWRAHSLRW